MTGTEPRTLRSQRDQVWQVIDAQRRDPGAAELGTRLSAPRQA